MSRRPRSDSLAHWSLGLWVPPAAAAGMWTVYVADSSLMSARWIGPLWLAVIAASLLSLVVAGVYWLAHIKDLRAGLALMVNIGGLAANGLGLVAAAAWAAG
jgi:hypothetical protein